MDHLALEIGGLDAVVVDDAQVADARGRQVLEQRGSEPARADHEDASVQQPPLAQLPELREKQVPGVAGELGRRQRRSGRHQRAERLSHPPSLDQPVSALSVAPSRSLLTKRPARGCDQPPQKSARAVGNQHRPRPDPGRRNGLLSA